MRFEVTVAIYVEADSRGDALEEAVQILDSAGGRDVFESDEHTDTFTYEVIGSPIVL